ncbi:MAG: IS30 family transposase [Gammaproteobacteria bacterium]|nr:IS30 family transposase [Gammaproteobacteria bacterium]
MSYKQLDYLKRCQIQALWKAGYNQSQIAKEIGVHKSTISRELKKNIIFVRRSLGYWAYKANYAQTYADDRKKYKPRYIKFNTDIKSFVIEKIRQDWSPDQISGYAKRHRIFSISHEWIYQFILQDRKQGGCLFKHLRHRNKKYRKRYGSPKREGPIKNRVMIDDRPEIVDKKERVGDWEIDTIIGKNRKQAIVSIVERKSKFTILKKVTCKTAKNVTQVTVSSLRQYIDKVHSITADNGSEFAYHKEISEQLDTEFYFAHPYSSWKRGLNENTNGLVRQYLKKGSCFDTVTEATLINIMHRLNTRPRKHLNYLTPQILFSGCGLY